MSDTYLRHNWQDGEIITAPKMNNLEIGITEAKRDIHQAKTDLQEQIDTHIHPDMASAAQVSAAISALAASVEADLIAHNGAEDAHPSLLNAIAELDSRLRILELKYNTNITGTPWEATFTTLDGLIVTGVWNKSRARLEF